MSRSKYDKTIEGLVDDMSYAIEQCKAIIVQEIPKDISEDKMHNVLKGKRMATEDAVYYAKQIDLFERELNGELDEEETVGNNQQPLKRFTKK